MECRTVVAVNDVMCNCSKVPRMLKLLDVYEWIYLEEKVGLSTCRTTLVGDTEDRDHIYWFGIHIESTAMVLSLRWHQFALIYIFVQHVTLTPGPDHMLRASMTRHEEASLSDKVDYYSPCE